MLIAVYGTLRKGDYNYDRKLEGHQPLVTERVEGFEMYNLSGTYPYVARGADSITVEVYDVPEEVAESIESMEIDSGYDKCKVKTSQGIADIFYMTERTHADLQARSYKTPPRILSGDWFEWLRKYKPERLAINSIRENTDV